MKFESNQLNSKSRKSFYMEFQIGITYLKTYIFIFQQFETISISNYYILENRGGEKCFLKQLLQQFEYS
jgi:hypothetical protein